MRAPPNCQALYTGLIVQLQSLSGAAPCAHRGASTVYTGAPWQCTQAGMSNLAHIQPSAPSYTSTFDSCDAFSSSNVDNTYSLAQFRDSFKVDIKSKTEEKIVFHASGIDAPIANALRRIVIAEVPTMAIETVNIYNNTSIIQDEVLAHRLGLIPIRADPHKFEFKTKREHIEEMQRSYGEAEDEQDMEDETNTLVFRLQVKCHYKTGVPETQPLEERLEYGTVYAHHMQWCPFGDQAETFADDPPRIVHPNIVIAKLRPGQELDLELKCEKGLGKDHAKWSPVATASYRLLPDVRVVGGAILDGDIEQAQLICGKEVFDIVQRADGHREAILARPELCSMARNGYTPEWAERIKIFKVKNHFIFSIESAGQCSAEQLFLDAIDVFMVKIQGVQEALHRDVTG